MAVFREVVLCSLAEDCQRFRSCCYHNLFLMMHAANTSETLLNFCRTHGTTTEKAAIFVTTASKVVAVGTGMVLQINLSKEQVHFTAYSLLLIQILRGVCKTPNRPDKINFLYFAFLSFFLSLAQCNIETYYSHILFT
jgi:hypothetical protein